MTRNKIDDYKKELTKRYIYLYENATFILAPFMYEQTKEEVEAKNKIISETFGEITSNEPNIYFNNVDTEILQLLEEMLLGETPLEDTKGYKLFETLKHNKTYLEKVKIGMELVCKENQRNLSFPKEFKIKLNLRKLLIEVRNYIEDQSGDLRNKDKKLTALDEYFRIYRYSNDGKIKISGYKLLLCEMGATSSFSGTLLLSITPSRDKTDVGVINNDFINYFSKVMPEENNYCHFTEEEKQQIYLRFHDELPWNLEITCDEEKEYIQTMIETRLIRPANTKFCEKKFYIKEEDIFIRPNDNLYKYYQLCPHCGCIVNIPKEILSDGVKQRIEERCSKDEKLFRKMYLYSELISLDNLSKEGQRKILKK